MLKPMFTLRLSNKHASLENLDNLVYRLSKLYDKLRRRTDSSRDNSTANLDQQQIFVRKTTKYWVHPDNVAEVKCTILKYLPVLVYPTDARVMDPAVSSVYFDNKEMDLYKGRLEKTEGAEAIRIRWYGKAEQPPEVFVERKLHREDWTGELSIKARFPIKEKYLNSYLGSNLPLEKLREKLSKKGKYSEEELTKILELANEIQKSVREKRLRPTIRTFYNRIAFQLPGDARVRISLDTELCMIREDGPERSGENWRRVDISGEFPFSGLVNMDVERFPYAVLEVKLQTEAGEESPKWVQKLVESHLVEAVPRFSKYIHGSATLLHKKVDILPYWYNQMDIDIRKQSFPKREKFEVIKKNENEESVDEIEVTEEESIPILREKDRHIVIPIKETPTENMPLLGSSVGMNRKSPLINSLKEEKGEESKKIIIPVRVEPKVFFANERTFLSWVHFAIFLGGISTALVGLGDKRAKISGCIFAVVSIMFTVYALYLYLWRARKIRERDPGPYDDLVGPWIVVIVFLLAMIANILIYSSSMG
jgi:SPX domain protein involved in polyphosphate accumulation/uncharacterized membrane protein YidH (DUF202 family)